MAEQSDLTRVHERIEALGTEMREAVGTLAKEMRDGQAELTRAVASLTTDVRTNIELCRHCRPIVIGRDGRNGLGGRVKDLEATDRTRTRIAWGILGIVGTPTIMFGAWLVTKAFGR